MASNRQLSAGLILTYLAEYPYLRESHLDLSHLQFHKKYGLCLQCPWNVLDILEDVVASYGSSQAIRPSILVLFSSTEAYKNIYTRVGDKVQYLSWHEIFTGMHIAQSDIRYIQRVKSSLTEVDLVIFLDPPSIPEVIDQVRGQTANALVILSGN